MSSAGQKRKPAEQEYPEPLSNPFKFQRRATSQTRNDTNGILWATLEEFPEYEISNTKIVRYKANKIQKSVTNTDNCIHFWVNGNQAVRSVNLLYRKTFHEFESSDLFEDELWCEVLEYPNFLVSNMGRILNKQILQLVLGTRTNIGYIMVKIKNSKNENIDIGIHQLVCLAFIGKPPTEKHTPNHKNGMKDDNNLANLEYATNSEQMIHAFTTGLVKGRYMGLVKVNVTHSEIWKPVPAKFVNNTTNHNYQVSNLARVRVGDNLILRKPDPNGYTRMSFHNENKTFNCMLHVVVATVFVPNPNNLPEVDHINTQPHNDKNNKPDNLEWVTRRENNERAHAKAVARFDPTTKETIVYRSAVRAVEENPGFESSSISRACTGSRNTSHYKGYQWFFTN